MVASRFAANLLLIRGIFIGVGVDSFFGWVVIGLLAGWLTGKVTHGRGFGCFVDVLLGLIGAVIGGWVFFKLGVPVYGFIGSLAAATVGAVILVSVARLFAGGR